MNTDIFEQGRQFFSNNILKNSESFKITLRRQNFASYRLGFVA